MKQTTLSGVQPTGRLHIGNYLGAIKNFVDLQNSGEHHGYFAIVDHHSLTIDMSTRDRLLSTVDIAASYLAAGLDPKKSVLFIQSWVGEHTELAWILSCITPVGELGRMTQFKDKSSDGNTNAGLFTYPILMAADVLLYSPQIVPVGEDQLQHLELARTIARKFNNRFGETFIEPKPLLTSVPRLMSLSDPTKKMSKSEPSGCLFLDDEPETIRKKINRAVTDSEDKIRYDAEKKPGIANLLRIASAFSNKSIKEVEKLFKDNTNYGDFKKYVAEVIIDHLTPFQSRKAMLMKNPRKVLKIFKKGSEQAKKVAHAKLNEVKEKIGLIPN